MTDTPTHLVHDAGAFQKYFHLMPNMYDDDLDPYEYRLLGHYKRVGVSWEGTRQVAEKCKMSVGQVSKTRKSLAAKNLLKVEMLTRKKLTERGLVQDIDPDDKVEICVVTVVDVTEQNVSRYAKSHTVHHVNTPVHGVNTPVHQVNERITIEEEPLKNTTTTIAIIEPPAKVIPIAPVVVVVPANEEAEKDIGRIFKAYEGNIGPLAPMIAANVKDTLKTYSGDLIIEAIGIAVKQNVRKWSYVIGILERWGRDGKQDTRPIAHSPVPNRPELKPHVAPEPEPAAVADPAERVRLAREARNQLRRAS